MKNITILALGLFALAATAQNADAIPSTPSATASDTVGASQNASEPAGMRTSGSDASSDAIPEPSPTPEISSEGLAAQADSAYMNDNFVQARDLYLQAQKQGGTSPALFYNLGNTYYRMGDLGRAILYYERALRLDPTFADARDNLQFVQSKITDKQIDDGSVMTNIWHTVVGWNSADGWAWVAIILFAVFLACVAVYVFAQAVGVRKFSFFGGGILFLVIIVVVIICFAAANRQDGGTREAVVISPAAQLSTSPRVARNSSEQAFILHEGTKVEVVDSVSSPTDGRWYEVRIGRERAWVRSSDIEQI